jgi:TldD protein
MANQIPTGFSRRSFLQYSAAGTAMLTLPQFLAACGGRASHSGGGPGSGPLPPAPPSNPFFGWFGIDEQTVRRVLAELTSNGADFADLYFQHLRSTSVSMEDGIVHRADSGVDLGVGLRCVIGDQVGYAYTEELTLESMLGAARTAAAIARGGKSVPPQELKLREPGTFYKVKVPWSQVGIDDKLPLLRRAESLARAADPAVTKVSVSWADSEDRVLVADSAGLVTADLRPMSRLWVTVTAQKNGQTQSNSSNLAGRRGIEWYDDARLQQVVKEAVDRTMILFDARRPPAGEMPVVLAAGASGILLHEAIGHGLEADFNRKGVSIYSDMLGKPIAPDFVTIVDDATVANERGALNVDDEGTTGERTVLIENGVLKSYLHDRISARHYKVQGTGSGRRESFRHVVLPRMRCTYMENGPHSRDEIIAAVQNGIIAETFTNGQVEIGAGDFTFYIKNGWLIENGKVTAPIKDVNIIGNGPEALKRVTMAANDSKLDTGGWTCGKDGQGVPVSQGLPTVLVSKMTVGGGHA